MKTKKLLIVYSMIFTLIIAGLTTITVASASELVGLKGKNNINQTYSISASSLLTNKSLYCIQHNKPFHGTVKFTIKDYVEIDGKEAKIYTSKNQKNSEIVNSKYNAEIAYILSKKQGYGSSFTSHTSGQNALWHIMNNWVKKIFGNDTKYAWYQNNNIKSNGLNKEAEKYAEEIGNLKSQDFEKAEDLKIEDKTDKNAIAKVDVGNYFRIGPFNWEFNGKAEEITVTTDKGKLSNSNMKIIKYKGTDANEINIGKLSSGDNFYIDVAKSSGASGITKMKLKVKSTNTDSKATVYTAKIWFLSATAKQNLIYVKTDKEEVKPKTKSLESDYKVESFARIGLVKVDDRDGKKPLQNVGFVFRANVYRYIVVGSHQESYDSDGDGINDSTRTVYDYDWRWVQKYMGSDLAWSADSQSSAKIFTTGPDGRIDVSGASGESTQNLVAIEVSNPYYGYDIGKEYSLGSVNETRLLENHQYRVKLSGYVWLDENQEKRTIRNEIYDQGVEKGFNGIKVYLRDRNGNEIKNTITSELGLYNEINGGEYQFTEVDLDKVQAGEYYIEFEYCGIQYQSVIKNLDADNGSKAIDTYTRNILDKKFASVDGNGTQTVSANGVTVNYNNISNYSSTIKDHTGCNVYARTNEAGYDMYSHFIPTSAEIRYINLGLFEKAQTDYALAQDLYNVKTSVNGFNHIYKYGAVRYNTDNSVNEESSWNMGVKFQKNTGTYNRAIYQSDTEYETPNHRDNEIQVYVTYKIALRNEGTYLGKVNSIVDYCDSRYDLVAAGSSIDDNTSTISGNVGYSSKQSYNGQYSKYIVDVNTVIESGQTRYVYLQFKMNRSGVLMALNDGELLNNVTEINSYTTFKDKYANQSLAVIDYDSVPGNAIPGKLDTYEDDTDAARSLKLELRNARAVSGMVFVDQTGKDSNIIYSNQERIGNGVLDNGEKGLAGIEVKLVEIGKDDSSYDGERKVYTSVTDENGQFVIDNFVPGNYVLVYTWGDKTYKVQEYKGTIYNEENRKDNKEWYKQENPRYMDAFDNENTRKIIDDEMEAIMNNTLKNEIEKAYNEGSQYIKTTKMDTITPVMAFSVEYDTTVTDGMKDEVKFTVKNADCGIVERAKQALELTKRVTGFKVTLANGQVLADAKIENGKVKGLQNHMTYMGPTATSKGFVRIEMDNELIEGAILEVTYTMEVKNISEIDYESMEYYYYGRKTGPQVRLATTELIDYVDGRLSVNDNNWELKDTKYLKDVNARRQLIENNETSTKFINSVRTFITKQLTANELQPNEIAKAQLLTSKILTSTDDNTFDNESEIALVSKHKESINTGRAVEIIIKEGEKFGHFDVGNSETVIIIPSTGEDRNYTAPIILAITSLLILSLGAYGIIKFVIKK